MTDRPMDGGLQTDGACIKCEREGVVLLDGHLCERCHGEVWAEYEDSVQRFGLYSPDAEGGIDGGLVAVGIAYGDNVVLAWLSGPPSAEVYRSIEGFTSVYQERENLATIWF